jgi:TonB-linked SusC/RagA family outer membrane protein
MNNWIILRIRKIVKYAGNRPHTMNLTLVLMIFGSLQIQAAEYTGGSKLSFTFKDASIEEIFREIENQSDYRFLYRNETIENKTVTVNAKNDGIEEVLSRALADADIEFTILENNLIVIKPTAKNNKLQGITITGRVLSSSDNTPLPGVNVVEKGTQNGTVTDLDGNYSLTVSSPDAVVTFSFIGYLSEEMTVSDQTTIDINLQEDILELDEVVFIGYGSMKRSDLTGAVASLSEETLKGSDVTTLDQALQGRIAGVQVTQNSGQPGGATSVRIRGASSVTGSSEPLYVIDGIPFVGDGSSITGFDWAGGSNGQNVVNPLSTINPNDIVDIQVLKDASASAIYGSQAANGVILITTKNGRDGKTEISYSTYYSLKQVPKQLEMMDLPEFAEYQLEIADELNQEPNEKYLDPSLLGPGTNWQDEIFRTSWTGNHQLSFKGGTEKANYYISGSYYDENGIIIGSDLQRITTRINLDSKINDWVSLGARMSYAKTDETITLNDGSYGVIMNSLLMQPDIPVHNFDGEYAGPAISYSGASYNPVALALIRNNTLDRERIIGNYFVSADITKKLNLRSELGIDNNTSLNKAFDPTVQFGVIERNTNYMRQREEHSFFWIWKNYLTYNRTIAGNHNLSVMFGNEIQKSSWEGIIATTQDFVSNDLQVLDLGEWGELPPDGWKDSASKISYFGRFNYNYREKYLATFTLRRDGSSKFGSNNKWGWFPSGSIAWRISEEEFVKNIPAISNLKLRLGYGMVGNEPGPTYLYGSTLISFSSESGTAYRMEKYPNPDLQWESTAMTNLGIDLALYQGRIQLTVDLYDKVTDNMLLQTDIPSYLGGTDYYDVQAPTINAGKMQNRGVEISVFSKNIKRKVFEWSTRFDFSLNRNKIIELTSEGDAYYGNIEWYTEFQEATLTTTGEPLGVFYGYVTDGIFENEEDILNHAVQFVDPDSQTEENPNGVNMVDKTTGIWIGDIRFKDINNDGVVDENDRTIIGDPNPDFTFGFNNTFTFRNFDLSIYLTGSYGAEILNFTKALTESLTSPYDNQSADVVNRARYELIDPEGADDDPANVILANPGTSIPRYATNDFNRNNRMSDRYIEDGSYLRIQNVSIGYIFPRKWTKKAKIQQLRLRISGKNLYTFTNYSGYDPEIGAFNQNSRVQNIDMGRYPAPRMIIFGLDINF